MAVVLYNFMNQPILASALVQVSDSDSFYFPEDNGHYGYAFNGSHYTNGIQGSPPLVASWYSEGVGPYRGSSAPFPSYGLILLGRANLTILDESTSALKLWMTFLLSDLLLLTDNFALGNQNYSPPALVGYIPSGLSYANGVISVVYSPDAGAESLVYPPQPATSSLIVNIDFATDSAWLDTSL
jgi:hypothetical protein